MKQLLSAEQIHQGVERLASQVGAHYAGKHLTVLGVLTGSLVMVADLIRQLDLPLQVGVIQTRSYRGNSTRPGELSINDTMLPDLRGRDVLLIDDIFDTGRTLSTLCEQIKKLGPASVRSAVLLRKVGRQEVAALPDYVCFEIPDAFVVGYGLDYQDQHRQLPYVAMLEECEIATGSAP